MAEIQPHLQVMLFSMYFTGFTDRCSAEAVLFFASSDFFLVSNFSDSCALWSKICFCFSLHVFSWPLQVQQRPFTHTHFWIGSPSTYWFTTKMELHSFTKIDLSALLGKSPHNTDCSALWTSNTSQSWAIRHSQMASVANTGTWTLVAG